MNKINTAIICMALPIAASAQSPIDAQQITQSDFKGTARFMSMGGAFTALGGDLSTLAQNPAGIGIYRSSEVGATLDINMQSTKTPQTSMEFVNTASQTKTYCNNFGYIGSTLLDGALRSFNWGVTFNRLQSFDRVYNGYVPSINTSLTNYIASFTNGVNDMDMGSSDWNKYNPYYDSDIDWLSILAYNSYLINPIGNSQYAGLFNSNSKGDALFSIREQGAVDEYDISFGGNVEDVVYWGLTVGITDLSYKRWAYYNESIGNATVPTNPDSERLTTGNFGYDLDNFKYVNGSGWNIKAGVIVKPINELRIGLSVHTPTWYSLNEGGSGTVAYRFTPDGGNTYDNYKNPEYTDESFFEWKLKSPWKLTLGVAGVIGGRAIISADYEMAAYNTMRTKIPYYYNDWGHGYDYVEDTFTNDAIKETFRNSSTLRLGAEYRVTPQFSVRAGYNTTTSNVKDQAYYGDIQVATAGTDPSYTFEKSTSNITCGLGYRYKAWYIDAAYVYTHRTGVYHAFTDFDGYAAPSLSLEDNNSSIVLSTGFKF